MIMSRHRQEFKAKQVTIAKLLGLLEFSEADKLVAHLYHVRKQYRLGCERRTKETGGGHRIVTLTSCQQEECACGYT
jgi:hypothetical protein